MRKIATAVVHLSPSCTSRDRMQDIYVKHYRSQSKLRSSVYREGHLSHTWMRVEPGPDA